MPWRGGRISRDFISSARFGTSHKTPHQYLQERPILRAKQLLASGRFSVTDVCLEVGFESLGSFSTLFRRLVGQAPATYRSRSLIAVPHLRYVGPRVIVPSCFMSAFGFDSRRFEQPKATYNRP